MDDYLQEMVDKAVALTREVPSKEFFESLAPIAEMDPSTLLPELFLQVEEAARGIDLSILQPTELVPDVDFARNVVRSVIDHDMELLRATVEGGYPELVIGLISVVAALKNAESATASHEAS